MGTLRGSCRCCSEAGGRCPHKWPSLGKHLLPDSKAAVLQAGPLGQPLRCKEPTSWEQASDLGVPCLLQQ